MTAFSTFPKIKKINLKKKTTHTHTQMFHSLPMTHIEKDWKSNEVERTEKVEITETNFVAIGEAIKAAFYPTPGFEIENLLWLISLQLCEACKSRLQV